LQKAVADANVATAATLYLFRPGLYRPLTYPASVSQATVPIIFAAQYAATLDHGVPNTAHQNQFAFVENTRGAYPAGGSGPTNTLEGWVQVSWELYDDPFWGTQHGVYIWRNATTKMAKQMAYATSRTAEPQRAIVHNYEAGINGVSNPTNENRYDWSVFNSSYNYGWWMGQGNTDIYYRPHPSLGNPNQYYYFLGTGSTVQLRGRNIRWAGFAMSCADELVRLTQDSQFTTIDHNRLAVALYHSRLESADLIQVGARDTLFEHNDMADSGMRAPAGTTPRPTKDSPWSGWQFAKSDHDATSRTGANLRTDAGRAQETTAIYHRRGGMRTVIRYNDIHGPFNAVAGAAHRRADSWRFMDVYDNRIRDLGDDGVEFEGGVFCLGIWGNRFDHVTTMMSLAPCHYGPIYVVGNTVWRYGVAEVGPGSASGKVIKGEGSNAPSPAVIMVHNTMHSDEQSNLNGIGEWQAGSGEYPDTWWMPNNILRAGMYAIASAPNASDERYYEDYGMIGTADPSRGIGGQGGISGYRNTYTTGYHTNLIDGVSYDPSNVLADDIVPRLDATGDLMTNPRAGDLTLPLASPIRNVGMPVPNLSDTDGTIAPDIGYTGARITSTFTPEPPPSDTTPPTISALTATPMDDDMATVTWTTNESATSRVYYDSVSHVADVDGSAYAFSSADDTTANLTSHSVGLTDLNAWVRWYYRVRSADAAGNVRWSAEQSFRTRAASNVTGTLIGTTAIRVAWTRHVADETAWRIERSSDAGATWTVVTESLPTGTTQYDDTGLLENTRYRYRVTALKGV
jgi:hypothetical protein